MSGEQYEVLLKAFADALIEKDRQICVKDFEIERLENKLADAESHLNPNGEKPKTLEIR